jgi:hypothetical protein
MMYEKRAFDPDFFDFQSVSENGVNISQSAGLNDFVERTWYNYVPGSAGRTLGEHIMSAREAEGWSE